MRRDRAGHRAEHLVVYQHDGAAAFRFVLEGKLDGAYVSELESAWSTARSVLRGRELVFDLSSLKSADEAGWKFLSRMRESGARIVPPAPPRVSGR